MKNLRPPEGMTLEELLAAMRSLVDRDLYEEEVMRAYAHFGGGRELRREFVRNAKHRVRAERGLKYRWPNVSE